MAMIWMRESNRPAKYMIDYAMDPSKTEGYAYVSCIGCDPKTAEETFLKTKEWYDKKDGCQTFHVIQSFKPGEVGPMVAHEIGNRFIKMLFDDYEVVLATHTDKPNVHNHIVFNSVSDKTGRKYKIYMKNEWKKLCDISDQLCREYNLVEYKRRFEHTWRRNEWEIHKDGMKTQWDLLNRDVDETTHMALDLDNFFELMEKRGYQIIRRKGRFPLFEPKGSSKRYGIHQGGKTLTEEDLQRKIEIGMEENESVDWEMRAEEKPVKLIVETEKGLALLYQSMLNVLMVIGQGEDIPYPLVRYEEIKRFRQYKEQQEYLEKNGIETVDQLQDNISELEKEIHQLKKEKEVLRKKRKQLPGIYETETDQQKEEWFETGEADRREITESLDKTEEQLKKLKHELYLCRRVENESPFIKEKLSTKIRDRTMENERKKQRTRTE